MGYIGTCCFVLLAAFLCVHADLGVDMSVDLCGETDLSTWQCLNQAGYTIAIIEGFQGSGGINTNIASCVSNAWSAGFTEVDVYIWYCPNCNNTPDDAGTLVNYLSQNSVKYNYLWFDVETGCSSCWNDPDSNAEFLAAGVQSAVGAGANVGIYSSEGEWGDTVGNYSGLTQYPLWYAHYDGNPSFGDGPEFYGFGGWSGLPYMKQYDDNGGQCGIQYDLNWKPGGSTAGTTSTGTTYGASELYGPQKGGKGSQQLYEGANKFEF